MADEHKEQLKKFLSDVYSIEQQALVQMRTAPKIAGDPVIAQHFEEHLRETEGHAEMMRERLEAVGGSPSKIKDAVMRAGGKGFLAFAASQPDTPGKLTAHGHSYEALELAAYEMLIRMARLAGDSQTARAATTIRDQEDAMRERLASDFDRAVDASLRSVGKEASETITTYLKDAHGLEAQAIQLLEKAPDMTDAPALARIYQEHLEESKTHARLVEERLEAIGEKPSKLKDAGMRAGAVNWGLFFQAQDETAAKLAAFAYAFEHLEIAGYELLKRVAKRAGDTQTEQLAEGILADERAMAERVFNTFDEAFAASVGTASYS